MDNVRHPNSLYGIFPRLVTPQPARRLSIDRLTRTPVANPLAYGTLGRVLLTSTQATGPYSASFSHSKRIIKHAECQSWRQQGLVLARRTPDHQRSPSRLSHRTGLNAPCAASHRADGRQSPRLAA